MTPTLRVTARLLDAAIVIVAAVIVFVALTGGTAFHVGTVLVRLWTTGNLTIELGLLVLARYLAFGAPAVERMAERIFTALNGSRTALIPAERAWLAAALAASVALRILNIAIHPGFATGDDVEIHQMTLRPLVGGTWEIWNLRSALYPMAFVYPPQWLAHSLGIRDVGSLVAAGRLTDLIAGTIALLLIYRITARLTGSASAGVAAAILLGASRLHLWFGSSELPRPVASAFLLGAFLCLTRSARAPAGSVAPRAPVIAAGVLLGIGGALRFGELLFFVPAVLQLVVERRWRDSVLLAAAGGATAALLLGVADLWYWGRPFSSLLNAFDYTIVRGASSRGFQPPWYYLAHSDEWTNAVVLLLGAAGIAIADRRVALWTWVPLLLLSALPHKEARYAIPVLPFLCIGSILALRGLPRIVTSPRVRTVAVGAVVLAVVFEASNWRFRRSDDGVRLAGQIDRTAPAGIAAEQLWRLGGPLYLPHARGPVTDLTDPIDLSRVGGAKVVVLRRESTGDERRSRLAALGYAAVAEWTDDQYEVFVRP